MITAIADAVAQGAKLANTVETNLNRPDMIADAVKRYRQKHRDAVDQAQAVLSSPNASKEDKDRAFEFIQRIES